MLRFTPASLPSVVTSFLIFSTTACMRCTVFTGTSYTVYKKRHLQIIYRKGKVCEIACEGGGESKNTEMLRPRITGVKCGKYQAAESYNQKYISGVKHP